MKYLVIDSGLYVELANALSDGGKNVVYYYTPFGSAFPMHKEYAPGDGFGNLTKIKYFWDYVDQADCIVNFDVSSNDMINWLRKKYPEKSIFGSGLGERMENDRLIFKRTLEALELPVIPYKVIKGMTALRKYLESNPQKVVKINIFRKDFETLKCDDYLSVKQILDNRSVLMGPYSESDEYLVEDMIPCKVEAGFDGFFNGEEYGHLSVGYELDKNLYLGKVGGVVPDILMETLDAFQPVFKRMNYRGALSTEERIVSRKEHYFIDPCMRCPLPLGVLYSRFINNWPEVVYNIGVGKPFDIDCDHKYVGAYALSTRNAEDYFALVQIKKGFEDDFRFMMACCDKDGNYYAVKGLETVVVVVAGGDSAEEVVEGLKEKAENVKAYGLEMDEIKGIDRIYDVIAEGRKFGIDL